MISGVKISFWTGWPAALGLILTLLTGGCATLFERSSEDGETRIFQVDRNALMLAIRAEVEDRDYRVRHADARAGRLTALSWVRSQHSFHNSRQTELDFFLEDLGPDEMEVRLRIYEIEERDLFQDRPAVSRRPYRDATLYRMIFDGIAERLEGAAPSAP